MPDSSPTPLITTGLKSKVTSHFWDAITPYECLCISSTYSIHTAQTANLHVDDSWALRRPPGMMAPSSGRRGFGNLGNGDLNRGPQASSASTCMFLCCSILLMSNEINKVKLLREHESKLTDFLFACEKHEKFGSETFLHLQTKT